MDYASESRKRVAETWAKVLFALWVLYIIANLIGVKLAPEIESTLGFAGVASIPILAFVYGASLRVYLFLLPLILSMSALSMLPLFNMWAMAEQGPFSIFPRPFYGEFPFQVTIVVGPLLYYVPGLVRLVRNFAA